MAAPIVSADAASISALLLLADGRFPDGSHAHSFGMEAAVAMGRVHDPASLHRYIEARLWTTTRTDAAAAALAARGAHALDDIDAALTLRQPSPATRAASRSLGRSLVRTAARIWPGREPQLIDGRPPLQPIALGAVATLSGCGPLEAALCTTHAAAASLASAALRLLGLDPFSVAGVLADLRGPVAEVAGSIEGIASPTDLPTTSTPLAELDPELQATIEPRLFGS
ncbi:urease accessory protein UreF [Aquihabitans sp. McL0605]|uniref:urease accessory protein UreF n=1 Tax=Aquihabitans sp. McL0605 TaxID=3415671 RepID=UPI003CECED81